MTIQWHTRWLGRCLLAGALLTPAVGLTGCSGQRFLPESLGQVAGEDQKNEPQPTPRKVHVDGQALALGQTERGHAALMDFAERTAQLIEAGDLDTARRWVERHPDQASELLRRATPQDAQDANLRRIAWFHDEHCCRRGPEAGWHALLIDRGERPNHYTAWDTQRERVAGMLRNGAFEQAANVDLPAVAAKLKQPLVAIDAYQLHGVSLLVGDRPREAAGAWHRAAELARDAFPYLAIEALLLQSEALRRAEEPEAAARAWAQSVTLAADLLHQPRPIHDPVYWDRAAYLRPVPHEWPPACLDAVLRYAQSPLAQRDARTLHVVCSAVGDSSVGLPEPESLIWSAIGDWRALRHEHQAALVAWKRAEAATRNPTRRAWLRLGQARALIGLDQSQAATAVLMELASDDPTRPEARAALAMLGSLKVQVGQTQQGFHLLRNALESEGGEPHDWPGRLQAEADYGLCCLLMGDAANGLAWLERAQRGFRQRGDSAALAQCLENQAAWHEHNGQTREAHALRQEVLAMAQEPNSAGPKR